MRLLAPVSEDEVVGAFLRAELRSERYGATLRRFLERDGVDPTVLERPDLSDPQANAYRRRLLREHRGWRDEGMFTGFPEDVTWYRAALAPEEVLGILYIDWDWWLHLSGGSRLPTDAAERIRRGEVPGHSREAHEALAAALRGEVPPPELIVAARPDLDRLVLVEGHYRLTAYALFPEFLPGELEVLAGVADDIDAWCLF